MKNLFSILLLFLSLTAFGQASTITFEDKDKTIPAPSPRRLVRDVDLNEIKTVVNSHAEDIDEHTTAIAGKQATLSSGSNIKTVQGTTLLGAGDLDLIDDTATNGVTDKAPSQNYVFDELALRVLLTAFVFNEVPSGTVNGTNDTFTIANTPTSGSLRVYLNGLRLKGGGVDYTQTGTNLVFVTAPDNGSLILIDYMK